MNQTDSERISKTLEALRKNNMQAQYVGTKEEALELVRSMLEKGCTVSHGGSMTLKQAGITELLRNGEYNYLDRSVPGLTRAQVEEIYRRSFFADVYL